MTWIATICVLTIVSATLALADGTTSPGKQSAYASVSSVVFTGAFASAASVTIERGKKKRVLEVTIMAADESDVATAVAVRPLVNGLAIMEPHASSGFDTSAPAVNEACNAPSGFCTVVGHWWLDLDAAEVANPGLFINQPLNVDAQVSASPMAGAAGLISVQARLMKK